MGFQLAKGERIVKEYNFGSTMSSHASPTKRGNVVNSLVITNKRVVSQTQGGSTVIRKEIPLSSADYVSTSMTTSGRSIAPFIVFLILGIAFAALAYFSPLVVNLILTPMNIELDEAIMNYIALGIYGVAGLFAVLAIINLILFIAKRSMGVEILISGKCYETELLNASSTTGGQAKPQPFKFTVNRKVATALVNELGALLIDLRAGNYRGDAHAPSPQGNEPDEYVVDDEEIAAMEEEERIEEPTPDGGLDLDKPIPEDYDDDTPIPESIMDEPIPGK